MRLTKNDPTGNYSYLNDGFSPASDVLTDGYSTFTPGISETKGAAGGGYASEFYLADAGGHSRGLLNGNNTDTDGYNWDAFGNLVSRYGSNPTMFAWNEDSGYQTDNDDGLALLGSRYYDKRTGRFISQDPAEAGDNWYAYAYNNPVNRTDPLGLDTPPYNNLGVGGGQDGTGEMDFGAPSDTWIGEGLELDTLQRTRTGTVTSTVDADGHITHDTIWGPWGPWSVISSTPLDSDANPTLLYRGGPRNPGAFIPRPGIDTEGPERGLSFFDTPEAAVAGKKSKVYQTIGTDSLSKLQVFQTGEPGHYSLRPETQAELDQWAATKGTGITSPYTTEVLKALVGSPQTVP